MQQLFEKARTAPDFRVGRTVSQEMWKVWLEAPDEAAQEVLDRGMRKRDSYDFIGALADFSRLAEYCPAYAEGFNQRAYIHFLTENYAQALEDLDIALSLQPDHVAAQSGRGLTLLKLGRIEEARKQMLIAVENNPWLSEATLLAKGAPLGPVGEDI
ncbi:tetratricopeptide repeat protein [Sulfitobacter sp. SK012]|uniref:tetratricopeptide repeat protein n=1 Tax=Sulfitobacter sp. SK012 TaxID=1389005 RepID=UPI0020C79514|nr:tetratricopeptide repeat protein [Sulfitobacter sp. SK012]